MYAVIETCGKQYKVAEGDVVFFEKLNSEAGDKVKFDKVSFSIWWQKCRSWCSIC